MQNQHISASGHPHADRAKPHAPDMQHHVSLIMEKAHATISKKPFYLSGYIMTGNGLARGIQEQLTGFRRDQIPYFAIKKGAPETALFSAAPFKKYAFPRRRRKGMVLFLD